MKTRKSTPHTVPRYGRRAATTKMRVKTQTLLATPTPISLQIKFQNMAQNNLLRLFHIRCKKKTGGINISVVRMFPLLTEFPALKRKKKNVEFTRLFVYLTSSSQIRLCIVE